MPEKKENVKSEKPAANDGKIVKKAPGEVQQPTPELTHDDIIDAIKELTKAVKELAEKTDKIYVKSFKAGKFVFILTSMLTYSVISAII